MNTKELQKLIYKLAKLEAERSIAILPDRIIVPSHLYYEVQTTMSNPLPGIILPFYPLAIVHGPSTKVCYEYAQVPEEFKDFVAVIEASMNEHGQPGIVQTDQWSLITTKLENKDPRIAGPAVTIRCLKVYNPGWDAVLADGAFKKMGTYI